jgi:hypothetical protein
VIYEQLSGDLLGHRNVQSVLLSLSVIKLRELGWHREVAARLVLGYVYPSHVDMCQQNGFNTFNVEIPGVT